MVSQDTAGNNRRALMACPLSAALSRLRVSQGGRAESESRAALPPPPRSRAPAPLRGPPGEVLDLLRQRAALRLRRHVECVALSFSYNPLPQTACVNFPSIRE